MSFADGHNMDLDDVIATSEVVVHDGRYAYLKADEEELNDHFLISQDADETTVVTEEEHVDEVAYEDSVEWFKLFEIQVSEPFVATGFLATVTETVADAGLNILIVSTFSKDYALIKEEDWRAAADVLEERGFPVADQT